MFSMWKVAVIRPVATVGTPSGPSDFRPISIVSVLSKAFERILHDQVVDHVNCLNLLSDFQSGFRRGHSTATALVRVTEDLRSAKAEGKVTVHVLLDFSKAFDIINHGLFVHKLDSRYDFHTSAMGMVSPFLRDRSMVVEVDGVKSTPCSLSSGVPQGCIPSPQFFLSLSMICVLVFVLQSITFTLMIYRFIWLGIVRIWMR
jgi:hypothetical protein